HGGRPSQAGFCDCSTCSQDRNPGRAAFEPCPHLKTIGYMRGLDGRQPGGRSKVDPSDRSTGESDRNAHDDQDQPFGTSQLDDARRLASRLSQEEDSRLGGRQSLSIGILGSDLYDKLLLLRALRPEFPQAVFFTTDLDARLLMSDEQPFVRNLVVASARGLTTARDIQ